MKPTSTALALATAFAILATPVAAADYVIDTKGMHASINFRIKHLGFSWLAGRFDRFNGEFSYDEKSLAAAKVAVDIDTASINSNNAERDKHLRSADFLDIAKFPKATFVSTAVTPAEGGKMKIAGKLMLHGVTKEIVINAERIGGGPDPWGGVREGFAGNTVLTLADFGITKDLGPSAKQVEMTLHLEGVKK